MWRLELQPKRVDLGNVAQVVLVAVVDIARVVAVIADVDNKTILVVRWPLENGSELQESFISITWHPWRC